MRRKPASAARRRPARHDWTPGPGHQGTAVSTRRNQFRSASAMCRTGPASVNPGACRTVSRGRSAARCLPSPSSVGRLDHLVHSHGEPVWAGRHRRAIRQGRHINIVRRGIRSRGRLALGHRHHVPTCEYAVGRIRRSISSRRITAAALCLTLSGDSQLSRPDARAGSGQNKNVSGGGHACRMRRSHSTGVRIHPALEPWFLTKVLPVSAGSQARLR